MLQALKEASVSAQPAKTDSEGTLWAKLEEVGAGRLKLSLTYRGAGRTTSADAMGDLEHLDDLVYSVVAELRPRLLSSSDSLPQRSLLPSSLASAPPVQVKLASLSGVSKRSELTLLGAGPKLDAKPSIRPEAKVEAKPEAKVEAKPEAKVEAKPEAKPGSVPTPPGTTLPPPPTVSSPTPNPSPAEVAPKQRPRVAVGLLGEPMAALPAGYYGLSAVGQHAMMSFLQQRLAVPVTATRLYSLVGGYEALEQSLRAGAHHTLMARLDALTVQNGVLSGRIHFVLLQDGKLLYDRSVPLLPTVSSASESPSVLFSRALLATLDTLLAELSSRLPAR